MSNARVLNADCPFCAILHDGAPATILRRGIHSLVIRPLGPVTEGHVIAIPYEHVSDAAADPHVTANTMGDLAVYAGIMRSQGELGDFNIITSAGTTATQWTRPTLGAPGAGGGSNQAVAVPTGGRGAACRRPSPVA